MTCPKLILKDIFEIILIIMISYSLHRVLRHWFLCKHQKQTEEMFLMLLSLLIRS